MVFFNLRAIKNSIIASQNFKDFPIPSLFKPSAFFITDTLNIIPNFAEIKKRLVMQDLSNSQLTSWIEVSKDSDFPIQNIPFGIFKTVQLSPRIGTIIGETVIDLAGLFQFGYFDGLSLDASVFENKFLNDFISKGKTVTNEVRRRISQLFSADDARLRDNQEQRAKILIPYSEVEMLLPVQVGDYTDFYSSIEHATNVGTMFRDPNNALLPNWKHLPVGYHGRSSSIIISGTPITRPKGQTKADDAEMPTLGLQGCLILN